MFDTKPELNPQHDAAGFFETMFAPYGDADAYIELRCFYPNKQNVIEWIALSEPGKAAALAKSHDERGAEVYFGVLPRFVRGNGTKASVTHCAWTWLDVDFKDTPESEAWARLEASPPDLVVQSGHGVHAYWQLSTPIEFTPETRRRFEAGQGRRIKEFGADPASKDTARVLRVPGTHNRKYTPARVVGVLPTVTPTAAIREWLWGEEQERSRWQAIANVAPSRAEREWAVMMAWQASAKTAGNSQAVQRWDREMNLWRREQAKKRGGFLLYSNLLGERLVCVESIPYVPGGRPAIYTRREIELLSALEPDEIVAAHALKVDFGGFYEEVTHAD